MPRYNHMCNKCTVADYMASQVDGLEIFIDSDTKDFRKEPLVWEAIYGISEMPEIRCPVCNEVCDRTMAGVRTSFIIPGNFALNKWECKTLSNIDKLKHDDPYAHMREPGEGEEKITQFKKALKRNAIGKMDKYQNDQKTKKRKKKRKINLGKKRTTLQEGI
jgi:hypothetical protein